MCYKTMAIREHEERKKNTKPHGQLICVQFMVVHLHSREAQHW